MKKLFAILSIAVLAFVITACGGTQDTTPTGTTTRLGDNNTYFETASVYYNGRIISNAGNRFLQFDLQGNLLNEHQHAELGDRASFTRVEIYDGWIVFTVTRGNILHGIQVICANDFSIMLDQSTVTRNVGHGRTEEARLSSGRLYGNNNLLARAEGETFLINILTGEYQPYEYTPVVLTVFGTVVHPHHSYGNFAPAAQEIFHIDTNESIINAFYTAGGTNTFTGTNFHLTQGQEVARYNPYTTRYEIIFQAPNQNTTFFILNDQYLIVQDRIGTFLYRFQENNLEGEFIREIILP